MWGGDDKKNSECRNFSGGPVFETSPFNAAGVSLVPGGYHHAVHSNTYPHPK